MAKNIQYFEDRYTPRYKNNSTSTDTTNQSKSISANAVHSKTALTSTDIPIRFRSLSAAYIAEAIKKSEFLDESYEVIGATYDIDYNCLYQFSNMYVTYSSSRRKNILVLTASKDKGISGECFYDYLSMEENADCPVYIESKGELIPIYGVGTICNVYLLISEKEYRDPAPLYDGYMVRIKRSYYKYPDSPDIWLFTCNCFETANQLLLQKYQEYCDEFKSETIPDNTSNEWIGDNGKMDSVHIIIIDLLDDRPARYHKGLV